MAVAEGWKVDTLIANKNRKVMEMLNNLLIKLTNCNTALYSPKVLLI
jgi:hypothetical protein